MFDSLRDNAYAIFLCHYILMSWVQFALLGTSAPAVLKGVLAVVHTALLAWAVGSTIRRIPVVARFV